jgi:hypothetical protein
MTTDATPTCAKLNAAETAQSRLLIQIVNAWISPAPDGRTTKEKGKKKTLGALMYKHRVGDG